MYLQAIKSEGLAHLSYFMSSNDKAVIVDPRRDVDVYVSIAAETGTEIQWIFETHRNEDYVIGSREMQERIPTAKIVHSDQTDFEFGDESASDGQTFRVGDMLIECRSTPGHTDDSMCYVVSDLSIGEDPILVFTGDTLFVGEVGRTDLVDPSITDVMARKLHKSLQDKILTLEDGVIVYPGHGAGSVCGGDIAARDFTSIGYEKKNNKWLSMDLDEFLDKKLKQNLILAKYFKHCEYLNTVGPPLTSRIAPSQFLNIEAFEEVMNKRNHVVIDTRDYPSFLKSHIPGSINIVLSGLGLFGGWILKPEQHFLFVLNSRQQLQEARNFLLRIGFDNVVGCLSTDMNAWSASGRPIEELRRYGAAEVKEKADVGELKVIDIRQPDEWETGYIEGSIFVPLTDLRERVADLDKTTPVAAICSSGIRSTAAASILRRQEFDDVGVLIGGMKEWRRKDYPLKRK